MFAGMVRAALVVVMSILSGAHHLRSFPPAFLEALRHCHYTFDCVVSFTHRQVLA